MPYIFFIMPEKFLQPADIQGQHILACGHRFMGDALMSTPFLNWIKEQSAATLTVLSGGAGVPVYSRQPAVDTVLEYKDTGLRTILRRAHVDCAILLKDTLGEALRVWSLGIPVRAGFRREGAGLLLNRSVRPRSEHGAVKYFRLAGREMPVEEISYRFELRASETQWAEQMLDKNGIADQPLIILVTGTTRPEKTWPENHFSALIDLIRHKDVGVPLLVGSTAEQALNKRLATAGACNLTGQTPSLGQLAALLSRAAAIVTGDTGPMHLACAFPTVPLIALFGQTDPQRTGPIGPQARVLRADLPCSPCHKRHCPAPAPCMKAITPQQVLQALQEHIAVKERRP